METAVLNQMLEEANIQEQSIVLITPSNRELLSHVLNCHDNVIVQVVDKDIDEITEVLSTYPNVLVLNQSIENLAPNPEGSFDRIFIQIPDGESEEVLKFVLQCAAHLMPDGIMIFPITHEKSGLFGKEICAELSCQLIIGLTDTDIVKIIKR